MGIAERRELIKSIEAARESRVLVYVTGDRNPVQASIGEDAVRPIIDHLRAMNDVDRLDVFIYSRGGAIDVPWRLNSAFRRTAKEWNALVPFRAQSAATLLSLGADQIILGPQGELGPIDPIMNMGRQSPTGPVTDSVSVEDIMAFSKFVTERFKLKDESTLSAAFGRLVDRLDAVTLGSAYRIHSHIRYLAERMLKVRAGDPLDAKIIEDITETLAERVYAHGHAVGLDEAVEIGLPAIAADDELDKLMWALLETYETDMKLLEPLDPHAVVRSSDFYTEEVTLSVVESAAMTHEFRGSLEVRAKRQMPPQLQVHMNLQFNLPPALSDPEQIPAEVQSVLQGAQSALAPLAEQAVQNALSQQAPTLEIDAKLQDARWRLIEEPQ